MDKFNRMKTNVLNCSHVIVICMDRQKSEKIPEIEEIEPLIERLHAVALEAVRKGQDQLLDPLLSLGARGRGLHKWRTASRCTGRQTIRDVRLY